MEAETCRDHPRKGIVGVRRERGEGREGAFHVKPRPSLRARTKSKARQRSLWSVCVRVYHVCLSGLVNVCAYLCVYAVYVCVSLCDSVCTCVCVYVPLCLSLPPCVSLSTASCLCISPCVCVYVSLSLSLSISISLYPCLALSLSLSLSLPRPPLSPSLSPSLSNLSLVSLTRGSSERASRRAAASVCFVLGTDCLRRHHHRHCPRLSHEQRGEPEGWWHENKVGRRHRKGGQCRTGACRRWTSPRPLTFGCPPTGSEGARAAIGGGGAPRRRRERPRQ